MGIDLSVMNCWAPGTTQLIEGETTATLNGCDIPELNHFNRTAGCQGIIGEQVVAVVLILGPPGFQLRFQLRFQRRELIQYSHNLSLHFQRRNRDKHFTN